MLAGCGGTSGSKAAKGTTTTAIPTTTLPPQDTAGDKAAGLAAALKLSDLPKGWTAKPHEQGDDLPGFGTGMATCLGVPVSKLDSPAEADSPDFSGANSSSISNLIGYSPTASAAQDNLAVFKDPKFPDCTGTDLTQALRDKAASSDPSELLVVPTIGTATVVQTAFPVIGDDTVGYRITVPLTALSVTKSLYLDIVAAIKGRAFVFMAFGSLGTTVSSSQEQRYMTVVVGRLTRT